MRRDDARLLDIVLACREVGEFVRGSSRESFLTDRRLQSAVAMQLQVIGEAARALSDEFKAGRPEVPWSQIVSLRHRIVHEYFRIDAGTLWEIVRRDVPELLREVAPLVPPQDEP
jgi:uncharacterized protein with HEPN domain